MILLVEDDEATRDSLCLLFECEGLVCRGFASAQAFLDEKPGLDDSCLVLDVNMAGMDGLALLEQLRAGGATVPAIMITGVPTPAILKRAAAAGAAAVLEKPFDSGKLIDHVHSLLARTR
jgi:FixJ family two-component response regulator